MRSDWRRKKGRQENAAPYGLAIPCGLDIPVTTLVITPVSKSRLPTEVSTAEYAAPGEKMFLEME